MAIETVTYTLPQGWTVYFINGDDSGFHDEEIAAIEKIEQELIEQGYSAIALGTGEDQGFMRYHDAYHVYPYAADCEHIIFPKIS